MVFAELLIFVFLLLFPVAIGCSGRWGYSVYVVYVFLIVIRQIVAICNSFFFVIPGADDDALRFHHNAVEIARSGNFTFGIDAVFFDNLLAAIYQVFGESIYLGSELSIISFSLSFIVFVKLMDRFCIDDFKEPILLVYGLLPSSIIFGSVTLRESHQALLFMLSVYFCLVASESRYKIANFFAMIVFALLMGLTHKGLIFLTGLLVIINFGWIIIFDIKFRSLRRFWGDSVWVFVFGFLAFGSILLFFWGEFVLDFGEFITESDASLFESILIYRSGAEPGRTSYGDIIGFDSPLSAISGLFLMVLYYLFSPFPWQITDLSDIIPFCESLLRALLLYFSFKYWLLSSGQRKYASGLLLLLYVCMSLMWSLGTSSFGTAMRHHLVAWWIIVLLGAPLLIMKIKYFFGRCVGTSFHSVNNPNIRN